MNQGFEMLHNLMAGYINHRYSQEVKTTVEKAKLKEPELKEALNEVIVEHVKEWNEVSK